PCTCRATRGHNRSVRSQLMHVYVQKSTSTTFPRRPSGVSGSELSQPVAPSNPGRCVSACALANRLIPTVLRCCCLSYELLVSVEEGADDDLLANGVT